VQRQIVVGLVASAILVFSIATGALAQSNFSSTVIAKGTSVSTIVIAVKNSSQSRDSIYKFTILFSSGKLIRGIAKGSWDGQKSGDTVTFTTNTNPIAPGASGTFLLKVANAAQPSFEWKAFSKDDVNIQSGRVANISMKKTNPGTTLPKIIQPMINVSPTQVNQSGQVIVTGKGFSPNSTVQIYFDDQQQITTAPTNANGDFSAVAIIPGGALSGVHKLTAKDPNGNSAVINIQIGGFGGQSSAGGATSTATGGTLTATVDKATYNQGETVKITGTATPSQGPVSVQVNDPGGNTICGANPPINNATFSWQTTCQLPRDAVAGVYVVQVKQLAQKTILRITVNTPTAVGPSGTGGIVTQGEDAGTLKISLNKQSYKAGDTMTVTISGARPNSLVEVILAGPTGLLDSKQLSSDGNGVAQYSYQLVGAQPGTYKVTAKQDKFVIRTTFEVTA